MENIVNKVVLTLLGLCLSISTFAETNDSNINGLKPEVEKVDNAQELLEASTTNTKQWGILGTYAYADTWLPGKLGFTGSYGDEKRVYEFAYQKAQYSFDFIIDDLGEVKDQRFHLTTRSHTWSGSFNFQYGLYYNSISAKLGTTYTDILGASIDLLSVRTLGVVWGVGNRWKLKNGIIIGADWFKVFWPLKVLEQSDDVDNAPSSKEKDDAQDLIDTMAKVPTFSVGHFEIGYRF